MPPKKKKPAADPQLIEEIWAAGLVSLSGSLSLVMTKNSAVVRYIVTSANFPDGIDRLARVAGAKVYLIAPTGKNKNPGKRISLQGAALHAFMTRIWDYLTPERKRAYAQFRKQISSQTEGPNPYRDGENPDEYED